MIRASVFCIFALLAPMTFAHADTPQSLSAQVGDIAFESGDDEITLVPLDNGSFTLSASTKGAAGWPPPKTRVDRLAITCGGWAQGRVLKLDHKAFENGACDVTFEKGTKSMGLEPDARYHLDRGSADNRFEVTAANGKVYEGSFAFRLIDANGAAVGVAGGKFRIEDRQL